MIDRSSFDWLIVCWFVTVLRCRQKCSTKKLRIMKKKYPGLFLLAVKDKPDGVFSPNDSF